MTERPPSSIQLIRMCLTIALQRRFIIWLPVLGFLLNTLVIVLILTPLARYTDQAIRLHTLSGEKIAEYVIIILFLVFITHQIIFFINSAVMIFIEQQQSSTPSLRQSCYTALQTVWPMYLWHSFAAIFGFWFVLFHLKWMEFPWYQRWVNKMNWIYATFLVHPIVTFEKRLPIEAVKCSAQLMEQTWGTPLTINYSFGWFVSILQFIALLPIIITLILHTNLPMLITALIISLLLSCLVSILNSLTRNVLQYVLYVYAKQQKAFPPFIEDQLKRLYLRRN